MFFCFFKKEITVLSLKYGWSVAGYPVPFIRTVSLSKTYSKAGAFCGNIFLEANKVKILTLLAGIKYLSPFVLCSTFPEEASMTTSP